MSNALSSRASRASLAAAPAPRRRVGRAALLALAALGCAAERPAVDAEAAIARSLGTSPAVVFHEQGAALDAGAPGPSALSRADALRRAVLTDASLQAALARVRAAEAEADLAGLLASPVLDFVVRFPEGGGAPDLEAGLAADLLALLQRPRRAEAAGLRLEAQAAQALSVALDVVAEVQAAYAEAQALGELVPVLEQRLVLLAQLREVAQARLEVGEGVAGDVAALEAETIELEVDLALRRQELWSARLALARSIGEPSSAAAWSLDAWSAPPAQSVSESACIEAGLASRPELLALEWELAAREIDRDLAGAGAFEGAAVGVDAERDGDVSIGPALELPLPLFGAGGPRKARARALSAEQRHRLTEAQRAVVEEVRSACARLDASQASLARVAGELVPLQERRREHVEQAFRVGLADVTALLFADQALLAARARQVGLERSVSTAFYELERATGGPSALADARGARGSL